LVVVMAEPDRKAPSAMLVDGRALKDLSNRVQRRHAAGYRRIDVPTLQLEMIIELAEQGLKNAHQ
jgi:hypothetical protein